MTGIRRPPLVLTGGPAAGKSATGRTLARSCARSAFIEADDVRQLVVSGAAAPWEGPAGRQQMLLAARNVSALARSFHDDGFDVVVADVLDPATAATYRQQLPRALVVHLVVSLPEARRRATSRTRWLTDEEFAWLHERDRTDPPQADVRLHVDDLDLAAQVQAVREVWR